MLSIAMLCMEVFVSYLDLTAVVDITVVPDREVTIVDDIPSSE